MNILFADTQTLFRKSFAELLRLHLPIMQIFHAESGISTLNVVSTHPIDLVFMDLAFKDMNGFEVLQKIRKKHPHVKVMVLTHLGKPAIISEAYRFGAHAFLHKSFEIEDVIMAIDRVDADGTYFPEKLSELKNLPEDTVLLNI